MELKELNLKPKDILLDSKNPRYFKGLSDEQDKIIKYVMKQKGTKELANSMKLKLQWVNKIVVVKNEKNKYVVVEGNTRTTILKSAEINGYDNTKDSKTIPVLLAKKETNETDIEFENELRKIQGMANVLAVKEWPAVVKAKFIFDGFKRELSQNGQNITEAIRSLAHMNGTSSHDIAKTTRMYSFFEKISELSTTLDENQYSMMEGFNKNITTRMFFGFEDSSYSFNLGQPGNQNQMQAEYEQRLGNCDEFIKEVSALVFRKKITCVIENVNDSQKFESIIDPVDPLTWDSPNLCGLIDDENIQTKWENILEKMFTDLGRIPVGSDEWSDKTKITTLITKISEKAKKQSDILNL